MFDEAIMTEALEEGTAAYLRAAKLDALPVGFDPTVIIQIIMAMLDICKKPASELKSAAEPTWAERMVVTNAARKAFRERHGLFGFAKFNGAAAVDAVFDLRKNSSEEKIAAFAACCG